MEMFQASMNDSFRTLRLSLNRQRSRRPPPPLRGPPMGEDLQRCAPLQFLTRRGRGTTRSVVEGDAADAPVSRAAADPSAHVNDPAPRPTPSPPTSATPCASAVR
jgi:hypothetical protein